MTYLKHYLLSLLLAVNFCYTQTSDSLLVYNSKLEILKIEDFFLKNPPINKNDFTIKKIFDSYLQYAKNGKYLNSVNFSDNLSGNQSTLKLIYQGDYESNISFGNDSLSFSLYQKAFDIASSHNDTIKAIEAIKRMLLILSQNTYLTKKDYQFYLNHFKNLSNNEESDIHYNFLKLNYDFHKKTTDFIKPFSENLNLIKDQQSILAARHYHLIGMNYDIVRKNYDSAIINHKKCIGILKRFNHFTAKEMIMSSNINIGINYYQLKKYDHAKEYLFQAYNTEVSNKKLFNKVLALSWLNRVYLNTKKIDSAKIIQNTKSKLEKVINQHKLASEISHFKIKYETEKKENENLKLRQEKKERELIVLSLFILLILTSIIAYLVYRNTKRKQRIAEQEKALAAERANNILNNQKLAIIDAMVSGQEKERERLASDLHDNIGNTMTSIKFYVEHLEQQLNNETLTPSLINNLKKLVGEAATKIRGISHEKNTGVFANEGLLIAIKRLAKAIQNNHKITINVWDHGLDKRIENRLELILFRIIQELLTNIIKHAEATEVSVSLTNHDNILNIMVEDDGIGFHLNDLKLKEGMGLRSIEIRIEKLGGSVEIDSYPNNGTTIIIDIPI